ncbi:MAG: ATP-binding protein [Candidatus Brocadiales bacterium]|nr:ATP-binding protein [Candidatus Brocadiales bacterium]
MASGKLLRQLFKGVTAGDEESFRAAAEKIIHEERSKKHHLLANDLQRILQSGVPEFAGDSLQRISVVPSEIPKDSERGISLLEVRIPCRFLGDVVLSDHNKSIVEEIIIEHDREELLRSHGLRPKSKLLFCGPPGCGKTLTAEVMAGELQLELVIIRFDAVVSSYLGETAANLRKVFNFLEEGRFVALFDEFDAIAKEREDEAEHGELKRVVNSFLQMIDSYRGRSVLISATNHEGMIDRALWRRFDEISFFDRPNIEQIRRLLELKLRSSSYDLPTDERNFIQQMDGFSHADIERVIIQAIKQMIIKGRKTIDSDIFNDALRREIERKEIVLRAGSKSKQRG